MWVLVRLPAAVALAPAIIAGLSPGSAGGEVAQAGGAVIGVSGKLFPHKLPRSHMVPATLRLGFTSAVPNSPATPELTAISFRISRNLAFRSAGLPSCPIADLYSESSTARQICGPSLVGHGTVISEVTLPGQAPVTIEGHLLAFYDVGEGERHILAQVTSTHALPLTYVIPFTIRKAPGVFGTTLSVRHMRFIKGECQRGHPKCFSQTYTYKGIYGHISKFALTLRRRFIHAGKKASFVNADCPAHAGSSSARFPFLKVSLAYPTVEPRSQVATRRCKVSASQHRRRKRS